MWQRSIESFLCEPSHINRPSLSALSHHPLRSFVFFRTLFQSEAEVYQMYIPGQIPLDEGRAHAPGTFRYHLDSVVSATRRKHATPTAQRKALTRVSKASTERRTRVHLCYTGSPVTSGRIMFYIVHMAFISCRPLIVFFFSERWPARVPPSATPIIPVQVFHRGFDKAGGVFCG